MSTPAAEMTNLDQPPAPVSLMQAFWFWLKLGFISFGGPAGQIAIMHEELVVRRRWLSEKRFLHANSLELRVFPRLMLAALGKVNGQ